MNLYFSKKVGKNNYFDYPCFWDRFYDSTGTKLNMKGFVPMTDRYNDFELQRTRICNILIDIADNHKDLILALKARDKAKKEVESAA